MSKPHLKTFIDVHLTYLLSSVFVHFHGPVSITLKTLSEVDFKNTFLFFNISIKFDGFQKGQQIEENIHYFFDACISITTNVRKYVRFLN